MKINSLNNNLTTFSIDNALIQKESQKAENFQDALKKAKEEKDDESLKKACKEFEAYFISRLFKEMRSTIMPGGLIEKSRGEEIFEEMLDDEYSKLAANGRGMGLADMLYKQLSKDIK